MKSSAINTELYINTHTLYGDDMPNPQYKGTKRSTITLLVSWGGFI